MPDVGRSPIISKSRCVTQSLNATEKPFDAPRRTVTPARAAQICTPAGKTRTNNDLEPFFGSYRYHERRCSGPKVACPGTVVRGSVRLVSAAATRLGPIGAGDLVPSDLSSWRDLRSRLERRQVVRTLGRRFRRDPAAYLKSLEDSLINQTLPPLFFSRSRAWEFKASWSRSRVNRWPRSTAACSTAASDLSVGRGLGDPSQFADDGQGLLDGQGFAIVVDLEGAGIHEAASVRMRSPQYPRLLSRTGINYRTRQGGVPAAERGGAVHLLAEGEPTVGDTP